MGHAFVVKHADELLDTEFMPKWQHREALGSLPRAVWGMILGEFIRSGGPVRVDQVAARLPQHPVAEVTQAIRQLDEDDMILVEESRVTIVYPFASRATPFKVLLADGRERYAVCAIDALGIAPMLGQSITIRSHCHHCRAPL